MARNPKTGLTDKRQRFAEEFLKDFNATAAYLRAGYSGSATTARKNGSRLLTNADIQAYLARLRAEVSDRAKISLQRTVEEVAIVAFSDITDILDFDSDGIVLKDSRSLPRKATAAISTVNCSKTTIRKRDEETEISNTSATLWNKTQALGYLVDFFGIRDDWNKARATLKRYGFELIEDQESELGWRLDRYRGESTDSGIDPDEAAENFFGKEEPETLSDI